MLGHARWRRAVESWGTLMNVRTICLAILHHGDASGYEIRKLSTEGEFAYFVDASFGAIYPALAKLEEEGLVAVRHEAQTGKPPRKVYSINDAGRSELRAALSEPPQRDKFKSEFLLIGMCGDLVDSESMRRAVETHRQQALRELAILEQITRDLDGKPLDWVSDYGRTCMEAKLAWLDDNHDRMIRSAGGQPSDQFNETYKNLPNEVATEAAE